MAYRRIVPKMIIPPIILVKGGTSPKKPKAYSGATTASIIKIMPTSGAVI
jgi:hypothetical protein